MSPHQVRENTKIVKEKARELGFQFCGVSKAEFLEEEAPRLESWLKNNMQGTMQYMENYFDMRLDPRLLVPGAKSVLSLMLNYYPEKKQEGGSYQISKYAYGLDYHEVIKSKLKKLLEFIRENIGAVEGRGFVDSAPVLDRAWARKSGLGWIGKNTNLINPRAGSFYFLSELIMDLELEPDGPIKDYCGTCTACIDACPTEAIVEPYVVDGSKCISYFTIELKKQHEIPSSERGRFENWMYGCDICQDVCPWNRFSSPHAEPLFAPREEVLTMTDSDWEELTEENFKLFFKGSPLKRVGFEGLKRNIRFLKESRG